MGKAVRCLGGACAAGVLLVLGAAGGGYLVHSWYSSGGTVERIARWVPAALTVGETVARAVGTSEAGLDLFFSKEEEFPADAPLPPKVSSKTFLIPRKAERPAVAYLESPSDPGELAFFYERGLAEKGWSVKTPAIRTSGEVLLVALKEGRILSVWIGTRKEAGSFAMLSVGRAD